MPKVLSEKCHTPLSTRMIFLRHRARMHDNPGVRARAAKAPHPTNVGRVLFLMLLAAATIVLGAAHD